MAQRVDREWSRAMNFVELFPPIVDHPALEKVKENKNHNFVLGGCAINSKTKINVY